MNYLLDTNVISEVKRPKPNDRVIEWFGIIPKESFYFRETP